MQHIEQHFSGSDTVRDVVIGMADGLTVPFALASDIAEIAAGSSRWDWAVTWRRRAMPSIIIASDALLDYFRANSPASKGKMGGELFATSYVASALSEFIDPFPEHRPRFRNARHSNE